MFRKLLAFILVLALLLPVGSALAVRYYRVNTSWLKAHDKPAYSATVLDSYRRDFAVTIAQKLKDGWAKVRFRPGGAAVYVQTKYLQACSSYTAYISQDNTALLKGPATSFKTLGKLSKGAKVTVLTHGSAFDYVSSSRGKGYVRNTHLTTTKPAKSSGSSSKQTAKTNAKIVNPANRTVNLRKGPGTDYKVLSEYRPGTRVTLLQYGSDWCKVTVKGKTGYIMTRYIQKD